MLHYYQKLVMQHVCGPALTNVAWGEKAHGTHLELS